MNILITTFGFIPEHHGVSLVAYHHAKELARLSHNVTVATGYHPLRSVSKSCSDIRIEEFKVSGNSQLRSRYKGEIEKYIDFIASFDGHIICCHCWQTWATDLAVRAFKKNRVKKILVSHGVSVNSNLGGWKSMVNWLLWRPYAYFDMRRIMNSFDHVVFLSNRIDKDRFYDRYLADKIGLKNYSVIPNGVELSEFDDVTDYFRIKYGIKAFKPLMLCVGNFSELKNQKLVLNVFIQAKIKNSVLVLIGSQKNSYSDMLNKLWLESERDLSTRFLILERVPRRDIISAYKAADLFINGSRTECFPLVVLESMASATPYISTAVGCVPDLPGGFAASSECEMVGLIRRLIQNKQERSDLGRVGSDACRKTYSWRIIGQQYNQLFNDLIKDFDDISEN